jgi:hypothetical protein
MKLTDPIAKALEWHQSMSPAFWDLKALPLYAPDQPRSEDGKFGEGGTGGEGGSAGGDGGAAGGAEGNGGAAGGAADAATHEPRPEEVEWKTGNGMAAKVIVSAQPKLDLSGNPKPGTYEIRHAVTLDGTRVEGSMQSVEGHPQIVARYGKLGISRENYGRIQAAEKTVENHPKFKAYKEASDKRAAERSDYERGRSQIYRAMNPD